MTRRFACSIRPSIGVALFALLGLQEAYGHVRTDSLDLRRFFPLETGNFWEYELSSSTLLTGYERLQVVGDTVIHDTLYFHVRTQRFDKRLVSEGEAFLCLRYDTSGSILSRSDNGEPLWLYGPATRFPFYYEERNDLIVTEDTMIVIGSASYSIPLTRETIQRGDYSQADIRLHAEGIGLLRGYWSSFTGPGLGVRLLYAGVGGKRYGERMVPGPDLLEPRGYIPLQVGNRWEYYHGLSRPVSLFRPADESELRRERYSLVDSLVQNDTIFYKLIFEEQSERGDLLRRDTSQIWYDDATASLAADANASILEWLMCLDADFGTHDNIPIGCSPFVSEEAIHWPELFGENIVRGKSFSSYVWSHTAVHGIGLLGVGGGCEPCGSFDDFDSWSLAYARVGGQTYGQPVVNVGIEPVAERPASARLDVWPNPAAGVIWVAAAEGEVIEVYDLLGRRVVRSHASSSGPSRIDLSGFASGVYVVVAGQQAATVVVR